MTPFSVVPTTLRRGDDFVSVVEIRLDGGRRLLLRDGTHASLTEGEAIALSRRAAECARDAALAALRDRGFL